MIRVKDIVIDVQNKTGDTQGSIFPLARLFFFINKILRNIALETDLFVENKFIAVHKEENLIDLGDIAYKIKRVETTQGRVLPMKSHFEMDNEHGAGWEYKVGTKFEAIVFDLSNICSFKLFPRVDSPYLGITLNSPFGMMSNFSDDGIYYTSIPVETFGFMTGGSSPFLKITYSRKFDEIKSIDDTIDTREDIIDLISLGVLAECLLDNTATQNMQTYAYISERYELAKRTYRESTITTSHSRAIYYTRRRIV